MPTVDSSKAHKKCTLSLSSGWILYHSLPCLLYTMLNLLYCMYYLASIMGFRINLAFIVEKNKKKHVRFFVFWWKIKFFFPSIPSIKHNTKCEFISSRAHKIKRLNAYFFIILLKIPFSSAYNQQKWYISVLSRMCRTVFIWSAFEYFITEVSFFL